MCDCPNPKRQITSDLQLICDNCKNICLVTTSTMSDDVALFRWTINTYISIMKENHKRAKLLEKVRQDVMRLQKQASSTITSVLSVDQMDREALTPFLSLVIPTSDLSDYSELLTKSMEITKNFVISIPVRPQIISCPRQHIITQAITPVHRAGFTTINCPQCTVCNYVNTDIYGEVVNDATDIDEALSKFTTSGQAAKMKNNFVVSMWIYISQKMNLSESDTIQFGNTWFGLEVSKSTATQSAFFKS